MHTQHASHKYASMLVAVVNMAAPSSSVIQAFALFWCFLPVSSQWPLVQLLFMNHIDFLTMYFVH